MTNALGHGAMHALLVTISKCDAQSLGMSRSMLALPPAPHKRELCLLCIFFFQKQRIPVTPPSRLLATSRATEMKSWVGAGG